MKSIERSIPCIRVEFDAPRQITLGSREIRRAREAGDDRGRGRP